jgi:hypothetical protein
MEGDPGASRDEPVGTRRGQPQNAARSNLVRAREGFAAMRAAGLGARQPVVQPLEQPRLEPAGIAGAGETLQNRCRPRRADHRGAAGVDPGSEERRGPEVVGSRHLDMFDRDGDGRDLVVRLDDSAASVGPADGT